MQKRVLKFLLTLCILVISGQGYSSITSDHNASIDSIVKAQHHSDFSYKTSWCNTHHKIDIAENEIEEKEDNSDLPIRFLECYNHSQAFHAQAMGCFIPYNKKSVPSYLLFCTIRI
jgi:hypothetical protein